MREKGDTGLLKGPLFTKEINKEGRKGKQYIKQNRILLQALWTRQ
jgi:hypothetical protein